MAVDSVSGLTWWSVLAVMVLALLVPLLVVDVPPMSDYPNHLARDFVLAFRDTHKPLAAMYAPDWRLIPNLAMDLILPPLMHVMPPLVAGRLVVALAVLLPPTGVVAFHRAFFERRSLWPIASGLFAYDGLLLFGFINFHIAIGLAFWAAALYVYASRRGVIATVVVGVVAAAACFVCHIYGFILFGVLVIAYEGGEICHRLLRRTLTARDVLVRGAVVILCLAPTLWLYEATVFASTTSHVYWPSPLHASDILLPTFGYGRVASRVLMGAVILVYVAAGLLRTLTVTPGLLIAMLACSGLYFLLPFSEKNGAWISQRGLILGAFSLFAFSAQWQSRARWARALWTILAVCFLVRIVLVTDVWIRSNRDVQSVRAVLAFVPPGNRVLPAKADPYGHIDNAAHSTQSLGAGVPQSWWNLTAFAVIDRDAYWPGMFAFPGQQPVVNRPPYDAIADDPVQAHLEPDMLAPDYQGAMPNGLSKLLASWNRSFDYLLILNSDRVPELPASLTRELELVAHEGFATLYKIDRPI